MEATYRTHSQEQPRRGAVSRLREKFPEMGRWGGEPEDGVVLGAALGVGLPARPHWDF
jgi:hypothetical protein